MAMGEKRGEHDYDKCSSPLAKIWMLSSIFSTKKSLDMDRSLYHDPPRFCSKVCRCSVVHIHKLRWPLEDR